MISRILLLILFVALFTMPTVSNSQVIRATGNATEASTQLVYYYDQSSAGGVSDSVVQITNTNDTVGVTIHVQIFRSYDADNDGSNANAVFCEERDFVDFLTPNDTHVYDLGADNFNKNAGETETDPGEETSITEPGDGDHKGFVVITPVVSEADLSAISFEHMIGNTVDEAGEDFKLNAMGRSAVDLATGDVLPDGTVLDGVTGGLELLQPEELLFDIAFNSPGDDMDLVGIVFRDSYGPAGLLGYSVLQGDATWTPFIFDFIENPTSCGNREVGCFLTVGLNDTIGSNNTEFTQGVADDLLCAGSTTPQSPIGFFNDFYLWTRIFVSGLTDTENHIAMVLNDADVGASWVHTNKDEVESNAIQAPTGITTRATSQLIYHYDLNDTTGIQLTNTNDTEGVWVHVQIFRNLNTNMEGIFCDERDFVDFLTPNDTHVYGVDDTNFNRNLGETAATAGNLVNINLSAPGDTGGFIVITPVVSDVDLSAKSFQHLIGHTAADSGEYRITAMGRDAVDLTTGDILVNGTVLDGISSGFQMLKPEELLFNVLGITDVSIVGVAFDDNYGPSGLLGYTVTPAEATWTPFIFDYNEDPTSCGSTQVSCWLTIGLNDTFGQSSDTLHNTETLLCAGTETPDQPGFGVPVGWTRIFVSGLGENTNHMGFFVRTMGDDGAEHLFVKGERVFGATEPDPEDCSVAGDEDGDGFADCLDPDCEADPSCENGDQCSDGEDNDGDGNADCADAGCDGATGPNGETCEAGVELTCDDGQDNDGDTFSDCDDPDCAVATNCIDEQVNSGGGGGCSVASAANPSILNFLLPMIVVGLVIGIRRKK